VPDDAVAWRYALNPMKRTIEPLRHSTYLLTKRFSRTILVNIARVNMTERFSQEKLMLAGKVLIRR
jgi:hypothetical protein